MDDIVDYIASKIHKRSKRSLWGTFASFFNPDEMDDSDDYWPTVGGNKSSQGSPIPISSDKEIVSWSCSCSQPNVKYSSLSFHGHRQIIIIIVKQI